tara:strand:+ start:202 stop:750 length:549 start_codon:yes stop_codon:yes gene_type:complete
MENLQNLAGKIEELKEKLSDGEYKELLELAKECYDKKEEEKRKFVKVMCIQSQMSLDMTAKVSAGDCNCENCQEEGHFQTMDLVDQSTSSSIHYEYDDDAEEYMGDIKKFRLKGKVRQTHQIILFEVTTRAAIDGFCIDMKNNKMTDYAYDTLLKDKYMIDKGHAMYMPPPISYVYLSHFES